MSDEHPLSEQIQAISGELVMVSASHCEQLALLAIEVRALEQRARRLEVFADEIVAEAQEDERISRGFHPVVEDVTPIIARARRLSAIDGPMRS